MKVGNVSPKNFVNCSMAVAVTLPLSFVSSVVVMTPDFRSVNLPARSTASSESGQWLEHEWQGLQSRLNDVALRAAIPQLLDFEWYETSGDAVYPEPQKVEILNVQIVDNADSDQYVFAHTDFDVWT